MDWLQHPWANSTGSSVRRFYLIQLYQTINEKERDRYGLNNLAKGGFNSLKWLSNAVNRRKLGSQIIIGTYRKPDFLRIANQIGAVGTNFHTVAMLAPAAADASPF